VLRACCAIVDSYAHLHAQNVLHADVHPRNILVDRDKCVRIVDFGLARRTDGEDAGTVGRVTDLVEWVVERDAVDVAGIEGGG